MIMASTTSFVETKEKFNLQFEQNDYVADVNDMETGPFSATTMEKYDVREEGNLSINDDIPKELIVHTNIENCEEVCPHFEKNLGILKFLEPPSPCEIFLDRHWTIVA